MSTLAHRRYEKAALPTRTKRELIAAKRSIALGKLTEFQRQCERLAKLVVEGGISRADAADGLFEAAEANDLIEMHGVDYIQGTLATAFSSAHMDSAREECPT
ncbi:hypothetical protein M2171_005390 [Bradyrhizobium japonicum USDA 38]|uniref:hypothetical protein n=1 Tax=Bradyrhizobium japonicum TaxID=375 RepID=UPI00040BD19A|nr:hypothetical protein [Bradyrhizobium japonicum]MCS3896257.1 hypothetical protein [Bradyrhizobium japonicum USDA 38]MCS3948771.1 hypothetical protein [Bradyrhizobium japonicum]